ncbi:MAG: hypothetical protein ACPGJF_05675 [Sinimarinibacterium flocculans]|uniref:hypothetical protein n=1 Tax=Sinimarinibacterium flocculans TaxID=985250 RepID=UPI003C3A3D78
MKNRRPPLPERFARLAHPERRRAKDVSQTQPAPQSVDELIALVRTQHGSLIDGLDRSDAYRTLLASYASGLKPAMYADATPELFDGCPLPEAFALGLVATLHKLRERALSARGGRGIDAERHLKRRVAEWARKQRELAKLLNDAADLFESGLSSDFLSKEQLSAWKHPSLGSFVAFDEQMNGEAVGEVFWCGTENLRRWAENIKSVPPGAVFPAAWRLSGERGLSPISLVAEAKGRSTGTMNALNAIAARRIAQWVPPEMLRRGRNGFKIIAELGALCGYTLTSDSARSTLRADGERKPKRQ